MNLDRYDLKILDLLQHNNRQSLQALAEQVNLSTSAVNRRIAVLEKAGMIRAHVALLDAEKLDRALTVIVAVTLAHESREILQASKARFAACPQVQQVYYTTGDYDFLLMFQVGTMAEYEALTDELFLADSNIKRFQTHVVLETVKRETAIPLVGNGAAGKTG